MLTHRNLRTNAAQGRAWVPGLVDGQEVDLRRAADVPRLRPHPLPHLRPQHRRPARPLPEVRRRPRARGCGTKHPPTFLPAVPPIYERLARAADERGVDLTSVRYRHLGRDVAAGVDPRAVGAASPAACSSRATASPRPRPCAIGNPLGRRPAPGRHRSPLPQHRDPRRRPRRPDHATGSRASGASCSSAARRSSAATGSKPDETPRGPARRRLVPHRRHRRGRRRRLRLDRRPHQGDHHHRRLQRHALGGRGRAARAPRTSPMPPSSASPVPTAARTSSPP